MRVVFSTISFQRHFLTTANHLYIDVKTRNREKKRIGKRHSEKQEQKQRILQASKEALSQSYNEVIKNKPLDIMQRWSFEKDTRNQEGRKYSN